jgi:hypothetical protein
MNNNGVATTPNNWVFIPLAKKHLIKRTDTYILFDVDGVASGIVNAKFLRKKESDEMVYLSLPANYEVNCNVREKVEGRWTTTKKYVITAEELRPLVLNYNKELPF